jgi:hypothetical protein
MKETFKKYLKKKIVVDTRSSWIYIGILKKVNDDSLVLTEVDVHDNTEVHSSKERYILSSKKTGIKSNRDQVFINLDYVVSFSLLDDVKYF